MRAILHVDSNWGIGSKNKLMFDIKKDMKFFRDTTLGKVVVMGLNTLKSFPGGKTLVGRTNIVLSDEPVETDAIVAHDLDELFLLLKRYEPDDVYVIGGASIYRTLFPYCTEILVTKVLEDGHADVFVPNLDKDRNYKCIEEGPVIPDGEYRIQFCKYKNLKVKK